MKKLENSKNQMWVTLKTKSQKLMLILDQKLSSPRRLRNLTRKLRKAILAKLNSLQNKKMNLRNKLKLDKKCLRLRNKFKMLRLRFRSKRTILRLLLQP